MERELILAAHKVCKAFGPTRALIDVDVEVRKGEIRGLIGENGSGKSTFCSIVAGALEMDSGELELHGEKYEVKSMVEAQNHGVAMIVQEAATFPRTGCRLQYLCRTVGAVYKVRLPGLEHDLCGSGPYPGRYRRSGDQGPDEH